MRSWFKAIVVLSFVTVGCGSSQPTEETVASDRNGARAQERPTPVATTGGENGACSVTPVHFDFDSHDLTADQRATLERDVQCLQQRSAQNVTVTGKADPRGTEEYNLALGERRARTVTQYMTSLGMDGEVLEAHSVGEEFARGTDESSWAEDRRADLDAN